MGKSLVIVESPAKAKTIEKYLGPGYRVTASMGHLRDLPKSTLGVDIEAGFVPDYRPIPNREETIEKLKEEAGQADSIYLATDPDREGEAISWHLMELLELPPEKTQRVTFNEITKNVVLESIRKPRGIDMGLVDAQQARRILDRIVGYKLSPLLWTKIRRGLSAGRVQSVAARLVVDREEEIRAFVPEEYWLLDAHLSAKGAETTFAAHYYGTEKKKKELHSRAEVDAVIAAVKDAPFTVKSVKRTDKPRSPAAPFITSTLQQEASRRLNMTPRRTMAVAQALYEGLPVAGQDSAGLITYMRTDSLRISAEAAAAAKAFIQREYGKEYYPEKGRVFRTGKNAQDAHEAIRPANVELTPEMIRKDLTEEQYRLYRLIWRRFVASQMANAVYDNVAADILSAGHVFKAAASQLKFPGFTKVYDAQKDEEEKTKALPPLAEGDELTLRQLKEEQKFTQPPARYTEDTLIRALEEKGIGRPSTYAPTVSTILDREYVVKEGKQLKPTALGETVTKFMEDRFGNIVDVQFTANMEAQLDQVEEGEKPWKSVLSDFYVDFSKELSDAEESLKGVRIKVPDEVTDEICPNCGKNLVVKSSRFGRFLGCPGYPECTFTKPIVIEMPGRCPKCGGRILKRTSKKGYTYYACEFVSECGFMTWDVPVKDDCPECGKTMFKRSGRGYRKPFCINEACPNFLPEDKRGYKKKTAENEAAAEDAKEEPAAGEKKPAAKRTPAKEKAAAKPAAKKTTAKKTASAAKKPARTGKTEEKE
ncbi:MAG: type I DNA topoisomerase [Oscillospiraceae bacterium]|nr:type I DNA topoisomerase [Oscillospiraceae bacterium]